MRKEKITGQNGRREKEEDGPSAWKPGVQRGGKRGKKFFSKNEKEKPWTKGLKILTGEHSQRKEDGKPWSGGEKEAGGFGVQGTKDEFPKKEEKSPWRAAHPTLKYVEKGPPEKKRKGGGDVGEKGKAGS